MSGEKGDAEVTRPITLYVSGIATAALTTENPPALLALDIELSEADARRLVEILNERMSLELPGTMRVRLFGRLVIG